MGKDRKMTRRAPLILVIAAVIVLTMSAAVFAGEGTKTGSDALGIALKDAGLRKSDVKMVEVEADERDGCSTFEIEFIAKADKTEYEYEIAADSGRILEKSVEYKYKHSKSKKKIGKRAAIKAVSKFSGIKRSVIKKGTCKYTYKHREGRYKIEFNKADFRYEYEVLAPTGKIIEFEYEII